MYEIQNAKSSNNSPLRDGLFDMMQRNRGSLTDGTLMPNAWRAAGGRGAGGGNFLPVNQQKPVSTTSSQDAGVQGPKPPTYQPQIQTRDAQGKTLPQYRMGIGHRILGTLTNFANGFAGNHAQPIYVGPGALNNRYYQEEAQRQKQNQENLDWWRTQHPDAKNPSVIGSPPEQDPNSNKDSTSGASGSSSLFAPRYSARERFALSRSKALPEPDYRFTAFNPTTNQRVGSHDGKTWSDLSSSDSTQT